MWIGMDVLPPPPATPKPKLFGKELPFLTQAGESVLVAEIFIHYIHGMETRIYLK